MNITFCNSPMPNQTKVSGISAAIGMLRPKIVERREEGAGRGGSSRRARRAGRRRAAARQEAERRTRRRLTQALRVSARSNQSSWKLPKVSAGLGQDAAGSTIRSSGVAAVTHHQRPKTSSHAERRPARPRATAAIVRRSAKQRAAAAAARRRRRGLVRQRRRVRRGLPAWSARCRAALLRLRPGRP